MKITTTLCSGLIYLLSVSHVFAAEENASEAVIDIPLIADAQVFAEFKDDYPMMINYFTENTFSEVQAFYNEQFGGPGLEQTRYGRLELIYLHLDKKIRVIVAQQNNKREVDILVEQDQ